jgi:hypothetical protein
MVDQEPPGLCECAGQDGVDGGSPRWPGGGEAVKRLGVAGLDGGKVLATVDGVSVYTLQPGEKGREVRDTPRWKKGRYAATYDVALDHTSLQRWASTPPCVPRPRNSPPC